MKYLLCCDLHARSKPEGALTVHKRLMRDITNLGRRHGCHSIICAGDIYHEKFGVDHHVLQMLYTELDYAQRGGCPWIVLRGNHEIPTKSKPHSTLLNLYKDVCQVVERPKILGDNNHELYMLPWYLPDTYIEYAAYMAKKAHESTVRHKVFISHIGLNEAQLSPSNYYRVPQRVSIAHLKQHEYTLCFLGDYHMTQKLSPRVMYGGAPIQLAFGDAKNQGVWLLDLTGSAAAIDNLKLTARYPHYINLKLERGDVPPVYDPLDFYRVQAHVEDAPKLESTAPDNVIYDPYGTRAVDQTERRLQGLTGDNPVELFHAYLGHKEIQDQNFMTMGTHVLKRAMAEMVGHK